MLLPLLLLPAALASDLLLPPVTPGSISDLSISEELTAALLDAMMIGEVGVVGPRDIKNRVGTPAEACVEEPECLPLMWARFPTPRMAAVGSAGWSEGAVQITLRFYQMGDPSPVEVMSENVAPGAIGDFAARAAALARDILPLVPERGAPPAPRPPPLPPQVTPEVQDLADELDGPDPTPVPAYDAKAARGLPRGLARRYEESGQSWHDFRDQRMIRAGMGTIELHVGMAFGDVDRRYDTRLAFEERTVGQGTSTRLEQSGRYEYETFLPGNAVEVGAALGFHPTWWLELGIYGGLQLGSMQLSTGWEKTVEGSTEVVDQDSKVYEPTAGMIGVVQPRARLVLLASGPVKPFFLIGGTLRFYDGYRTPDLVDVPYPDRPGGFGYGPTGGGGIFFDARHGITAFIEAPFTLLLAPDPYLSDDLKVVYVPAKGAASGMNLSLTAGMGYRF